MKSALMVIYTWLLILVMGCNGSQDAGLYTTQHFNFYYTKHDSKNIKDIAEAVEAKYTKIISGLGFSDFPKVNIHFYDNKTDMFRAVAYRVPNPPSWAGGFATDEDQVHMMSPNLYDTDYSRQIDNVIHEFSHCVSIRLNNQLPNNPRWLWEAVAVYAAEQFVNPAELAYMRNSNPPTLQEMSSFSNQYIYELGFTISEYILSKWGREKYVMLIRKRGNIQEVLEISEHEFEKQWFEFVKTRYKL